MRRVFTEVNFFLFEENKYSAVEHGWSEGKSLFYQMQGNWIQNVCLIIYFYIQKSSLGRYVFGSEISYNKAPPRLPGLGC